MRKLLPFLFLLAACGDDVTLAPGGPVLQFESEPSGPPGEVPTPRVDTGTARVTITGITPTPCQQQELTGVLAPDGTMLRIVVTATPTVPCTASGYARYTARITNLPAGLYELYIVFGTRQLVGGEVRIR